MVGLFTEAFPELTQWVWDTEVQRTHRFPFRQKSNLGASKLVTRPRATLICLSSFVSRQALYDLARPDRMRKGNGFEFFIRPDYCHQTVEKRWHLRQLITPFQTKGAQTFLLNPAKLKIIYKDNTRFFTSEIKAKEYLHEIKS